jgi:hypothetical protein
MASIPGFIYSILPLGDDAVNDKIVTNQGARLRHGTRKKTGFSLAAAGRAGLYFI